MSTFGGNPEKYNQTMIIMRNIGIRTFFDQRKPWVLVPDGSFGGFFDWAPYHLRVGPWSPVAPVVIVGLVLLVYFTKPDALLSSTHFTTATLVSSHPLLYSSYWWYNLLNFLFMSSLVLYIFVFRTVYVIISFTILSWLINTTRHGILALAPFLYDHHFLLQLNQVLRFPALASAGITSVVWNLVLFPLIYKIGMKTDEKKKELLVWNFHPRMVQLHVSNIIYAILNTMITGRAVDVNTGMIKSPQLFVFEDLWYGVMYGFLYGLFYTLILDRLGVHLYPIFSPRTKYVIVTWLVVLVSFGAFFLKFNDIMEHNMSTSADKEVIGSDLLSLKGLLGLNGFLIISCQAMASFINWWSE